MSREDLQMLGEAVASGGSERVYRAMWEINLSPASAPTTRASPPSPRWPRRCPRRSRW